MTDAGIIDQKKKDRSPNFPFISVGKCVERAKALYGQYRKEPTRIATAGAVWGYSAKSSGLLQTVAALKQFGLLDDAGSGDDRKVHLTGLALRIILDARPGQSEAAVKEAALNSRLIAEYAPRWSLHRPPDDHCISELSLERGFSPESAKLFIKVFDETVRYAGLSQPDELSSNLIEPEDEAVDYVEPEPTRNDRPASRPAADMVMPSLPMEPFVPAAVAFTQRLKVEMTVDTLRVSAILTSPSEVDKLIKVLEANKALLEEPAGQA